jgi:formylglycine-generating enzyme required for sulfatase activity
LGIKWFIILVSLWYKLDVSANNVQINNLAIVGTNKITFELSWENTWVDSVIGNNDAIWLFFKYRNAQGMYHTLPLTPNATFYTILGKDKVNIKPHTMLVGVMIEPERSAKKISTIISIDVTTSLADIYELNAEAIEMVRIPKGAFIIGDSSSIGRLGTYPSLNPFAVSSENSINVGTQNGSLYAHYDSTIQFSTKVFPAGNIPTQYPKGFEEFYSMKYEISQEQMVGFLNTLEWSTMYSIFEFPKVLDMNYYMYHDKRHGISLNLYNKFKMAQCNMKDDEAVDSVEDGQNVACNYQNWNLLTAYLDWAGLRPMTELEYEKICRGPLAPQKDEYAWGNKNLTDARNISNPYLEDEYCNDSIKPGSGIANIGTYNPPIDNAPMRCGFAANDQTDRLKSGASYYGVMEMTGNLWEQCINLSSKGILYEGTHGDGEISIKGEATNTDWEPVSGLASGVRGGGWNSGVQMPYNDNAVSNRFYIYQTQTYFKNTVGGRGVIDFK